MANSTEKHSSYEDARKVGKEMGEYIQSLREADKKKNREEFKKETEKPN